MRSNRKYNITSIIYDKRGNVMSIGKNSYIRTHPYQKKLAVKMGFPDKIYIHSEIDAILKCKNLKKAHSIFISRFDENGNPKNAKPCVVCSEALRIAGIKNINYTIG